MAGRLPLTHAPADTPRSAAPLLAALVLPALIYASGTMADELTAEPAVADAAKAEGAPPRPRSFGPPPRLPGLPPDEELESSGTIIGKILIDNQNIFNLDDPKDDVGLFRLANHLHIKTRPNVIRNMLLFKPGQHYDHRLLEESERILREQGIFYDAWIRVTDYHDGHVDVRVTTRDVWTLNPGFNFSRSGGTNSLGFQLEEINLLGTGADLKVFHSITVDRTSTGFQGSDNHMFGSWVGVMATFANASDGHLRELSVQQPFYALNTPWAAGVYGLDDRQNDSLWDRGQIINQFQDQHEGAQIYGGWSSGLHDGWVRRWSTGFTYDEHLFSPATTWTGATLLPQDRRFLYPWVQFDLIQDDYLRLWNHDQIARTEDFYLGTSASARAGFISTALGSNTDAFIFQSNASTGFRHRGSATILLGGDFSGRVSQGKLDNGLLDGSIRYYVEQSKNWLFFTTLQGTKGWRLDLDNQILLGGDNGLRGYPLRYQSGTARALFSVEQRYFTDWYPFRLFRVGGAVFFDAGRTWGKAPLAQPSLGLLKDAGFGLRFGNSRSGLGNVIHVDLAFPFDGDPTIKRIQFLISTEAHF